VQPIRRPSCIQTYVAVSYNDPERPHTLSVAKYFYSRPDRSIWKWPQKNKSAVK